MATKYTGKELQIKREIDRINRQIRQAFTKFGAESRLAQQYETLLNAGKSSIASKGGAFYQGVRYTKTGIPQISAGKASIKEFANITAYEKQLKILGRQQTVQKAQKAMIRAYEERTGQKVKGRKAEKEALQSEVERYERNETAFDKAMQKIYEIEKKRGVRLKAHDDIKKLSKGRWTSDADFKKMMEIAEKAANDENAEIVKDVFAQNQW